MNDKKIKQYLAWLIAIIFFISGQLILLIAVYFSIFLFSIIEYVEVRNTLPTACQGIKDEEFLFLFLFTSGITILGLITLWLPIGLCRGKVWTWLNAITLSTAVLVISFFYTIIYPIKLFLCTILLVLVYIKNHFGIDRFVSIKLLKIFIPLLFIYVSLGYASVKIMKKSIDAAPIFDIKNFSCPISSKNNEESSKL
jgi:hypothetical protein